VSPVGKGDLSAFFGLLADIYPAGPVRSHLFREHQGLFQPFFHPVLHHIDYGLFVARDGRRPVGRVAAIIDTHYPDPRVGFFGLFEAHRDQEAATSLLQAAGGWLRDRGKTVMLGPVSFNTNQKVGLVIDGFGRPPQPSLPFNPPYYQELLEGAGLKKEIDLLAYLWDPAGADTARLDSVAERARRRIPGLALRRLGGMTLMGAAGAIREVFNRSMAAGWGFVPLTDREVAAFVQALAFRGRGIYILAETATGPAGISLSLPVEQAGAFRPAACFRLAILGVVPEYRNRGLAAVLIQETVRAYARRGLRRVEFSLVAESNVPMARIIELSQAAVVQRCRVYRRTLEPGQDA